MKIGFIGLGIMGRPMALNLKDGGHDLIVPERASLTDEIRSAAKVVGEREGGGGGVRGADPDGPRHARMWRRCCSARTARPRG